MAFHDMVCEDSLKRAESAFTGYLGSSILGRRPLTAAQAAELNGMKAFLDSTPLCRPRSQGGRYDPKAPYMGLRPVRPIAPESVSPSASSGARAPSAKAVKKELSFERVRFGQTQPRGGRRSTSQAKYVWSSDEYQRGQASAVKGTASRSAKPPTWPKGSLRPAPAPAPEPAPRPVAPRQTVEIGDDASVDSGPSAVHSTGSRRQQANTFTGAWTVARSRVTGRPLEQSVAGRPRATLDLDTVQEAAAMPVPTSRSESARVSPTAARASPVGARVSPRGRPLVASAKMPQYRQNVIAARSIGRSARSTSHSTQFRGRPDFGPVEATVALPGALEGGRKGRHGPTKRHRRSKSRPRHNKSRRRQSKSRR